MEILSDYKKQQKDEIAIEMSIEIPPMRMVLFYYSAPIIEGIDTDFFLSPQDYCFDF